MSKKTHRTPLNCRNVSHRADVKRPVTRMWPGVMWLLFAVATAVPTRGQDTVHRLEEVNVSAQRTPTTMITSTPTQVMDAAKMEQQGALLLSDAVKQMAGVTLKDYGGVGGMKTVSARGLGSQFSTVTIDGIAISDAQNGQVDLGRYLLGNAAYVSFSQGQEQQMLLSARAYAAGNVLNLETAEPEFLLKKHTNLKIGMEMGNYDWLSIARLGDTLTWRRMLHDVFSTLNYTTLWEQRWNKRLKSSLWMSWLQSEGDYPFTLYYTISQQDSSSLERRRHSAMQMFTADGNLFYQIGRGNTLTAKLHYMGGQHQLPGPVQYYSQKLSAQNTREEVAFVQAKWRVERSRWQMLWLGKVQQTYDRYEDSAANTLTHYLMNDYLQREGYLSGSAVYHLLGWVDLRAAADGSVASLHSNLSVRNEVLRRNLMAVASVRLHSRDSNYNRFELNANLLGTAIRDRVNDLDTMPTYRRLSPFVGINLTFLGHTTIRYFYKETYRAPNFSELYFFAMPRDLRPERARQHNIGITHSNRWFGATVDVYQNRVSDKILAIPTQNMFLWSMQNLGQVEIHGLDATANFQLSTFNFQLNYSYQRALDRTDPEGKTYGHQIAYTPRHSGGGSLRWESRWVNLGSTVMMVGERYSRMQNSDATRLPPYCDLGLQADREFELRHGTLRVQLQVMNLLDEQYEVVRSYPMMGRNYRLKIMYIF